MNASNAPDPATDADAAREARISELAVGFALGEIADDELRELYDALREPGERGLMAAKLTWQQLGIVTDLRSGMGGMFQDTVKHRIAREGLSDRFIRESRRRTGSPRSGLNELSAPSESRPWRFRGLIFLVGVLVVIACTLAIWVHAQSQLLCRVTAVTGEATLGGEPLVVGMAVDHRQVVVPEGSQVGLSWSKRAQVTIAGPANVVAQGVGLSLANGAVWTTANDVFVIGLPDDTAKVAAGGRVAIEVHDGHSTFGVKSGQVSLSKRMLTSGEAATSSMSFPWLSYDLQSLPATTSPSPAWTLEISAAWHDSAQEVSMVISASQLPGGWHLAWHPGSMVAQALPGTSDSRTIPITGAPLGETVLTLVADHGRLHVSCAGSVLMDEALPSASSVNLPLEGRTVLTQLHFHAGPQLQPPFAER